MEWHLRIKTTNLAWCVLAATFFFLFLFSPFHEFRLWSQVTYLRGNIPNLGNLLIEAHLLRYMLVYPIFVLSDQTGINADKLFSAICFVMLFFTVRCCTKMANYCFHKGELYFIIFFALLFLLISAFMNGRIIFAFLGFSYLLLAVQNWEKMNLSNFGLLSRIFPALFLCSVSSGTFLSCFNGLILWSFVFINRTKRSIFYYILILLFVFSPILKLYLLKNINFFGGGFVGFVNMLSHGVGKIFLVIGFDSLIFLILIFANLTIIGISLLYYDRYHRLYFIFLGSSIASGFFGYSTLSLAIVPASIIMASYSALAISREALKK